MNELNQPLLEQLRPVLEDITERSQLIEAFIDKDTYCILAGTVWANVVLDPGAAGLHEDDLPDLHDIIGHWSAPILGKEEGTIGGIFKFLNSKAGERAMQAAQITPNHKDLLLFFASMILDPEGHRRWTDAIRDRQTKR